MTIDRPNLAGAFATKPPVDRAAGLAGLLPPARRSTPTPVAPAEPETQLTTEAQHGPTDAAASDEPETRTSPSRPVRPIRSTKAAPVSESADTAANVAVYLEPDLLAAARQSRRALDITYDELVVRAFANITDAQLQHLFQPAVQLIDTPAMPTRQRRLRGTAGIQIQLRLTGPQRTWLDQKQTATGAPSRSALVASALRLHLNP